MDSMKVPRRSCEPDLITSPSMLVENWFCFRYYKTQNLLHPSPTVLSGFLDYFILVEVRIAHDTGQFYFYLNQELTELYVTK